MPGVRGRYVKELAEWIDPPTDAVDCYAEVLNSWSASEAHRERPWPPEEAAKAEGPPTEEIIDDMPPNRLTAAEEQEAQRLYQEHGQRQPTPERYMRGMAFLELLWQQTVPGLSFKVVHDEPEQLPGKSTRTAMAALRRVAARS